jgi:hypothetical protein
MRLTARFRSSFLLRLILRDLISPLLAGALFVFGYRSYGLLGFTVIAAIYLVSARWYRRD